MESLKEKVNRVVSEHVDITPYNSDWPRMFREEKEHLLKCIPQGLITRIEHFGSTSVPDLAAKPIIDILVEVASLEETKKRIVPVLVAQGYDYFWRPTSGDDFPPFYAWFIKRNIEGKRTHHIHMVEHDFEQWERLLFRDYLIEHPGIAREYQELKYRLVGQLQQVRVAYTNGKTDFILKVTQLAKEYYGKTLRSAR